MAFLPPRDVGHLPSNDEPHGFSTEGLEQEEESALRHHLSQFEKAVHGEIVLVSPESEPSPRAGSRDRHQRIPDDRQTCRTLKAQVEEWKSAFVHLRVNGRSCAPSSHHEQGWSVHEPCAVKLSSTLRPTESLPPKPRQNPHESSSDRGGRRRARIKASPVRKTTSTSTLVPYRATDTAQPLVTSTTEQERDRLSLARAQTRTRAAADIGGSGGVKDFEAESGLGQSLSLPRPPDLTVAGVPSKMHSSPWSQADADDEEVLACAGDYEEVLAVHRDSRREPSMDTISDSWHIRMQRKVGRRSFADIKRRQDESQRQQLAETGMPPVEPMECAQHEATAILLESLWASFCPQIAPLLASLYRTPEPEPQADMQFSAEVHNTEGDSPDTAGPRTAVGEAASAPETGLFSESSEFPEASRVIPVLAPAPHSLPHPCETVSRYNTVSSETKGQQQSFFSSNRLLEVTSSIPDVFNGERVLPLRYLSDFGSEARSRVLETHEVQAALVDTSRSVSGKLEVSTAARPNDLPPSASLTGGCPVARGGQISSSCTSGALLGGLGSSSRGSGAGAGRRRSSFEGSVQRFAASRPTAMPASVPSHRVGQPPPGHQAAASHEYTLPAIPLVGNAHTLGTQRPPLGLPASASKPPVCLPAISTCKK